MIRKQSNMYISNNPLMTTNKVQFINQIIKGPATWFHFSPASKKIQFEDFLIRKQTALGRS